MSPAKDRAFFAALARFARCIRLTGHYNELPDEELHRFTNKLASEEAYSMLRAGLNSRQITRSLNADSDVLLTASAHSFAPSFPC